MQYGMCRVPCSVACWHVAVVVAAVRVCVAASTHTHSKEALGVRVRACALCGRMGAIACVDANNCMHAALIFRPSLGARRALAGVATRASHCAGGRTASLQLLLEQAQVHGSTVPASASASPSASLPQLWRPALQDGPAARSGQQGRRCRAGGSAQHRQRRRRRGALTHS